MSSISPASVWASASPSSFDETSETYRALLGMAARKFKPVPAELIVHQIIRVTADVDWPVREAAMEAAIRRLGFMKRDNDEGTDAPEQDDTASFPVPSNENILPTSAPAFVSVDAAAVRDLVGQLSFTAEKDGRVHISAPPAAAHALAAMFEAFAGMLRRG